MLKVSPIFRNFLQKKYINSVIFIHVLYHLACIPGLTMIFSRMSFCNNDCKLQMEFVQDRRETTNTYTLEYWGTISSKFKQRHFAIEKHIVQANSLACLFSTISIYTMSLKKENKLLHMFSLERKAFRFLRERVYLNTLLNNTEKVIPCSAQFLIGKQFLQMHRWRVRGSLVQEVS